MNKFRTGIRVALGIFDIFCFLSLSFLSLGPDFQQIVYFFLGVGYLILASNLFTQNIWIRQTFLFLIAPLSILAANIIVMRTPPVGLHFLLTAQIRFATIFVAIPFLFNAMYIVEIQRKRTVFWVTFLGLVGVLAFCLMGGKIFEWKEESSSLNRNGLYKYYYEKSGELWQEVNYVNGKPHGEYKMYHKNGKLEIRSNYINGKKDGMTEMYYENGQVSSIDHFKNGIRDGTSRLFYETGELMREISYKDGKEIKNRFYDKNGNLISEDNKQ